MTDFWADAEVVHRYTRTEAIFDGVLVDVSTMAAEAGFGHPAAMASAAWADTVAWGQSNSAMQDEAGRLWDALWMASMAIRKPLGRREELADRLQYAFYRIPNEPDATEPTEAILVVHIGGGDNGEPVITIMLPNED
jgi:hypothetical protein